MLNDRVCIVTGGGRGLGRVMATAIVAAGGRAVITGAHALGELKAVEAHIGETFGPGRLLAVTADVTDPAQCEQVVSAGLAAFGRIDALINNAGRGMRLISETYTSKRVRFWEVEPAQLATIFGINVGGAFNMTRAVMPQFLARNAGRIVNISTTDLTMVRAGYTPYGPSKAALEAMSCAWSNDLAETGITVNVLNPGGATATEFLPAGAGRRGADGGLLDAAIMGPPAVWLVSEASAGHSGERFTAKLWNTSLPDAEAAAGARSTPAERPAIM